MSELWIIVPGWEKFQHYKDRRPTWIKLYPELRDKDEWLRLTLAEQGLLVNIWMLYAASDGLVRAPKEPADVPQTSRKRPLPIPQKVRRRSLDSLVEAGFIELSASKPLALRYQAASPEVETEREEPFQTPTESLEGSSLEESQKKGGPDELLRRALVVAGDWNGGPSEEFDEKLDELERELHARLSHSQRSKLWDQAIRQDRRTTA